MSRAPWVMLKPEKPLPRARTRRCTRPRSAGAWSTRTCPTTGPCRSARARRSWPTATASRASEQDEFALRSHRNAAAAWDRGVYDDEVVARAGHRARARRDDPRRHVAGEARQAQARVPQGRHRDRRQLVSAERRRRGAAARRRGRREGRGREPLARIAVARGQRDRARSSTASARSRRPTRRWSAPASAGTTSTLVELNEAFAAQSLACLARVDRARSRDRQRQRRRDRHRAPARLLRRAPARRRSRTSCAGAAAAGGSRRCASASARASRWCWRHDEHRLHAATSRARSPNTLLPGLQVARACARRSDRSLIILPQR